MSNYNTTLQSNNTDLQTILNTINELPGAGGGDPILQDKSITPTTSQQIVTADSDYDGLSKVTVNSIPSDYIVPSGTKTITTNGTHDVKSYAAATVNVAGEDVTTETNAYTEKLATLETAITALETELQGKASGGSGSGGIETCIVDLDSPFNLELERLAYSNGNAIINISAENIDNINDRMSLTIAKNSILFIESSDNTCSLAIEGDAELISAHGGMIVINIAGDCSLDYELMLG